MTFKLKRTCREVTDLVLQGHDRDLAWHERAAVRLHWSICGGCRQFGHQADMMQQAMRRWRGYREGEDSTGAP